MTESAICAKTYFERGFADDKNLPVMGPQVLTEICHQGQWHWPGLSLARRIVEEHHGRIEDQRGREGKQL